MVLAQAAEYLDPDRQSQLTDRNDRSRPADTGIERSQQNMKDGPDEELEEARPAYSRVRQEVGLDVAAR